MLSIDPRRYGECLDGFTASQGKKELAGQELVFDRSLLGTHAILFDLNGYT